ncbi:MAG TPA: amidohydrolase family protein [Anaeromyxobacteraceae bacterium]|nr:amidohydrolase family protein [Anaeromyxobacteraceae bacterium]
MLLRRPTTRAAIAVAALCSAAVAVALGGTAAVERAFPAIAARDPESFALDLRRVDLHQHLGPRTVDFAVQIARLHGIEVLVNLSGGAPGQGLEEQLAAASRHAGRVVTFANLDLRGCCDEAWGRRAAEGLARARDLGARGLAVAEAHLAGAGADAVLDACASLGLPVTIEAHDDAPALAGTTLAAVERHPAVTFVAARFAREAGEPEAAARLLERYPNLHLDLGASAARLGRVPEAARRVLLAHRGRVLFATDVQYVESREWSGIVLSEGDPILVDAKLLGGKERRLFFEGTLRFLETRDPAIPSPTPLLQTDDIAGVGLPRDVLRDVYRRNAERLLGLRVPRGAS